MQETKLYYEVHVTIDPVFEDDPRREHLEWIAWNNGFKLARLLMKKDSIDPEQESVRDTFMTFHSKNYGLSVLATTDTVKALRDAGFVVRRYKIEDTLLDSKFTDELGILK